MFTHPRSILAALAAAVVAVATMNAEKRPPSSASALSPAHQFAYFGGGCFWCLDAAFQPRPGVTGVVSGYAGGHTDKPDYKQVCTGKTGHAEVVRIEYDPTRTSYAELLQFFFAAHDPTTLNRQGPDEGTQYRSIVLYANAAQKAAAEKAVADAQKHYDGRVVTEVVPLAKFYEAEEYHQDYFRKNPDQAYCRFVIAPKLQKLAEH